MNKKTLQILLELENINEKQRWELTKLFKSCIPTKYYFKLMKSRWVESKPIKPEHCSKCKENCKEAQNE